MKGAQKCTAANDPAFSKFRKETYFKTLDELKVRKETEAKMASEAIFKEREDSHQRRQFKKKKRLAKKNADKKNVHAEIVKW
jgi:23S rRNA pseudouridine2605 synthase